MSINSEPYKNERVTDEDDLPFNSIEDADFYAEWWYPEIVTIVTKEGDKICKANRSNARQPDAKYFYFFTEVKD